MTEEGKLTPVEENTYEQAAERSMTFEQKLQSNARYGVLRYLEEANIPDGEKEQLHKFADMAADRALEEYNELKDKDPAFIIESIVEQNRGLWEKSNAMYYGHTLSLTKDNLWRLHDNLGQQAKNIQLRAGKENESLTPDEAAKEIKEAFVELRIDEPRNEGELDTNLALLKAFGALPEEVTNLRQFLNELPFETDEDRRYIAENGVPKRPTRHDESYGTSFRGLPTKIEGVTIGGSRLYSHDTHGYGQWGFGLRLDKTAIERALNTSELEVQHSK